MTHFPTSENCDMPAFMMHSSNTWIEHRVQRRHSHGERGKKTGRLIDSYLKKTPPAARRDHVAKPTALEYAPARGDYISVRKRGLYPAQRIGLRGPEAHRRPRCLKDGDTHRRTVRSSLRHFLPIAFSELITFHSVSINGNSNRRRGDTRGYGG